MNKTTSLALMATAALLSLATVSNAAEAEKAKKPLIDQVTTQSVGTAAPRSCENQGFLSTDCAPADAGTKRYPENALQGLNLGF